MEFGLFYFGILSECQSKFKQTYTIWLIIKSIAMSYSCNASQKAYIRQAVRSDLRLDGRKTIELRKLQIEKGVLNQAQGSAMITVPFENIKLYASIKLQLVQRTSLMQQPEIAVSVESVKRRHSESNPR